MDKALQDTLEQLHQQLADLDTLDEAERTRLKRTIAEIQASLDRFDIRSADLAKRFHEETERFSATHPRLTQTAGQIADMLAQMGI